MIYDLSTEFDKRRFLIRVEFLAKNKAVAELVEKTPRSKGQNHYLHLLLGVIAMEVGETIDYVKVNYYKKLVNPHLFVRVKSDPYCKSAEQIRSLTELTQEEVSESIERLKRWGADNGFYLPEPGDSERLKFIEIEMWRMKNFL